MKKKQNEAVKNKTLGYAADYAVSVMKVQWDQPVKISMATGGGFIIKLSRQ